MTVRLRDYHVHTHYSDGHDGFDDYVRRALELGLEEIGFSDHIVPSALDHAGYGVAPARFGEYVTGARAAAARAADQGLRVLVGVEVDYVPEAEDEMAALLARHELDFAICSVHYAGDLAFDVARVREGEDPAATEEIFRHVYRLVAKAAVWAAGRCDIAGHVDLAKKFGQRPAAGPDLIAAEDEALAAIAAAGLAIELNTSGWRTPAAEAYPSPAILRRACDAGIPLTLGSDAHAPRELAHRFDAAVALARQAGYTSLMRLSDHTPVSLP